MAAAIFLAGQVSNTLLGRSHCLQGSDHARTELSDWHHQVPCSIMFSTFLQQKPYRRTAPTSSLLIARSLKPHRQCETIYRSMSSQTFQSNLIEATAKNIILQSGITRFLIRIPQTYTTNPAHVRF